MKRLALGIFGFAASFGIAIPRLYFSAAKEANRVSHFSISAVIPKSFLQVGLLMSSPISPFPCSSSLGRILVPDQGKHHQVPAWYFAA